jgi:hypothetical protein
MNVNISNRELMQTMGGGTHRRVQSGAGNQRSEEPGA